MATTPSHADLPTALKTTPDAVDGPYDFSRMQSLIDSGALQSRSFPTLLNPTLLNAALRLPVPHVPVWCHRQAGRYLPEFRRARAGVDFFTSCQTPLHAAELTVQPLARFPLDAAIVFSDILVVPQVMGLEVEMVPAKGPVIRRPITSPEGLALLKAPEAIDVARDLRYVFEAITLTRHALAGRAPLIGFSGAPFTLFGYMVEGGGSRSWDAARRFMYEFPDATHELMRRMTDVIVQYLVLQVEAGAQMLEVFDTNVGCLSPQLWTAFVQPHLARIAAEVKAALRSRGLPVVPMTVFPKGAHWALEALSHMEYDVVSIDWSTPPQWARQQVGGRVALQGNLDPAALFAPEAELRRLVRAMLDEFGDVGTIANLGHGMLPEHRPEMLAIFVDEVHRYSKERIASKGQSNGT